MLLNKLAQLEAPLAPFVRDVNAQKVLAVRRDPQEVLGAPDEPAQPKHLPLAVPRLTGLTP